MRRYSALKSLGEKKATFKEYQDARVKAEKEEARLKAKEACPTRHASARLRHGPQLWCTALHATAASLTCLALSHWTSAGLPDDSAGHCMIQHSIMKHDRRPRTASARCWRREPAS